MATVSTEFKEKLENKEVGRVYALIHGTVGEPGETVNASDVDLKTIRGVQLTPESLTSANVAGPVASAGSTDNSFDLLGTPQAAMDIHATILGQ